MTDLDNPTAKSGPLGPPRGPADRAVVTRQTVLLLVGLVGLLASLLIFGLLAEDVRAQEASALDALATPFLRSFASPTLTALMNAFSFLGSAERRCSWSLRSPAACSQTRR